MMNRPHTSTTALFPFRMQSYFLTISAYLYPVASKNSPPEQFCFTYFAE